MLDKVLSAKLREYAPANAVEQDNVLQEMMQHYVVSEKELSLGAQGKGLSRSG